VILEEASIEEQESKLTVGRYRDTCKTIETLEGEPNSDDQERLFRSVEDQFGDLN